MTLVNDDQKQALLDQVNAILSRRMSAKMAKLAKNYVRQYFLRAPLDDLARETPETLATIVAEQFKFLEQRQPGERLIRIFNPQLDTDGWESQHTIIETVHDDMPFLVDTAALILAELNIGVHLIIHPVMRIKRDEALGSGDPEG